MAIMASSTITLVGYLDAYGAAVEGGFEGSEEDFYDDLSAVEELPALSYTVTTHTTTINNQGIAIEALEEEFDETGRVGVAEQKITLIEAGEIRIEEHLSTGGVNLLENATYGGSKAPDSSLWCSEGSICYVLERLGDREVDDALEVVGDLTITEVLGMDW